jgi:hypothetical protein
MDRRLFNQWEEIVSLVSTVNLTDEDDEPVWQYHTFSLYSSQSLYRIINFRGVQHVSIPSVWKIKIPPRVQFFLWLLSKNKILTRDSLGKRRAVYDPSYLFYSEPETVNHLFFDCVVARRIWSLVSEMIGFEIVAVMNQ